MRIVFNSSPLIFLARLDFLGKFVDSSDNFYLPKSVADEIEAKDDQPSSYIKTLISYGNIEVKEGNLASLAKSLNVRLGKGESEAMRKPPLRVRAACAFAHSPLASNSKLIIQSLMILLREEKQ